MLIAGQRLFTRDGRYRGNAIVTAVNEPDQHGQTFQIETDFGNRTQALTEREIHGMYFSSDRDGNPSINSVEEWRADKEKLWQDRLYDEAVADGLDPFVKPAPSHPYQAFGALIDTHALLLEENPFAYFELAYTRQTGWMAWICSKPSEVDPNRKVLAKGQGDTPDEACRLAIESMKTSPGA